MPSNYTGNPNNNPTSIQIPSDGDGAISAADVNPAFEGLADKIEHAMKFRAVLPFAHRRNVPTPDSVAFIQSNGGTSQLVHSTSVFLLRSTILAEKLRFLVRAQVQLSVLATAYHVNDETSLQLTIRGALGGGAPFNLDVQPAQKFNFGIATATFNVFDYPYTAFESAPPPGSGNIDRFFVNLTASRNNNGVAAYSALSSTIDGFVFVEES